jgi:hypothetical protein
MVDGESHRQPRKCCVRNSIAVAADTSTGRRGVNSKWMLRAEQRSRRQWEAGRMTLRFCVIRFCVIRFCVIRSCVIRFCVIVMMPVAAVAVILVRPVRAIVPRLFMR